MFECLDILLASDMIQSLFKFLRVKMVYKVRLQTRISFC